MTSWLMIIFLAGVPEQVKYIEFPNKQSCETAMMIVNDRGRGRAVCVEGGKPILEPVVVGTGKP